MNTSYAGIDYHTKFAVATRMNKDGDIISTDKIDNTKEDIRGYLSTLPSETKVALESTDNWYAFCEWPHGLPLDIVLSHPQKTRVIAESRIKTDTIDSRILADLLRTDYLPQSYPAPAEVRDIRELIRFRTTLVRMKALFESKIYNAVYKNGAKTARIAVSRKLLCVIFAMLRSRQPFQITKDRQHLSADQSSRLTSG